MFKLKIQHTGHTTFASMHKNSGGTPKTPECRTPKEVFNKFPTYFQKCLEKQTGESLDGVPKSQLCLIYSELKTEAKSNVLKNIGSMMNLKPCQVLKHLQNSFYRCAFRPLSQANKDVIDMAMQWFYDTNQTDKPLGFIMDFLFICGIYRHPNAVQAYAKKVKDTLIQKPYDDIHYDMFNFSYAINQSVSEGNNAIDGADSEPARILGARNVIPDSPASKLYGLLSMPEELRNHAYNDAQINIRNDICNYLQNNAQNDSIDAFMENEEDMKISYDHIPQVLDTEYFNYIIDNNPFDYDLQTDY